jgi:hypothetical protein
MLGFRATQRNLASRKAVRLAGVSPWTGGGGSLLHLLEPSASIRQARSCSFDLVVGGEDIADASFAGRCFHTLHPSN